MALHHYIHRLKRGASSRITKLESTFSASLNAFRKTQLPGLIILGAQKAGTSSLNKYLNQHPLIKRSVTKEVRFFSQDFYYQKGPEWYKQQFGPVNDSHLLTYEGTPEYMLIPGVAERIHQMLPDVKLIVLVRDPVSRAFSSWNMYRMIRNDAIARKNMMRLHLKYLRGHSRELFIRLLTDPHVDDFQYVVDQELAVQSFNDVTQGFNFIRSGLYLERLQPFLSLFDREQLMIIESKELKSNTRQHLEAVCSFLDIPTHDWHDEQLAPHHVREYQSPISPETKRQLGEFYRPYNQAFFDFLGESFPWTGTKPDS